VEGRRDPLALAQRGAAEHGRQVSPFVGLRRRAILAERDSLSELAGRLRVPAPVNVQGVALAARLVRRSGAPLFAEAGAERDDASIHDAIDECRRALAPACPMPS
jgi:hypothetical protein